MAKPTSSLMTRKTFGAPCGARTGGCGVPVESAMFSAIVPVKGAGGIGRTVRAACAPACTPEANIVAVSKSLSRRMIVPHRGFT